MSTFVAINSHVYTIGKYGGNKSVVRIVGGVSNNDSRLDSVKIFNPSLRFFKEDGPTLPMPIRSMNAVVAMERYIVVITGGETDGHIIGESIVYP